MTRDRLGDELNQVRSQRSAQEHAAAERHREATHATTSEQDRALIALCADFARRMPESAARDFRASRWIKAEPERWLLVVRKPFQDPKQRLQTYVAARGWLTGWGKRIVTGSTSKGERSTYGRRELAVTLDGSPLLVISHEENDVLEASSLKADARGWPAIDFDLLDPIGICSTLLEKFERRYEDRSGPPHIWRPELSVAIYESWPMLSDQFEPFLAEVARAMAHEVDGVT